MDLDCLKDKLKIAGIICTLLIALAIPITIAAYWIYSQVVTVELTDYSLTTYVSPDGLYCYIDGYLKTPSGSPVLGATIEVYRTDLDGVVQEPLGNATTDATGHYGFDWIAPSNGTYHFKTGYQVP